MTTAGLTPSTVTVSLKDSLNAAKPDTLADILRLLEYGTFLRGQAPQQLRRMVPAADANAPASTAKTVVLPLHARASRILRAYSRKVSANAVVGELTPDTGSYVEPATGHIAVQPDGNIALLGTDVITDLDVEYIPERGDVVVLPALPVTANVCDLAVLAPNLTTSPGGVVLILSAIQVAGGLAANTVLRVIAPATTNATSGSANLYLGSSTVQGKSRVLFAAADAVTSVQLTLLVCAANDLMTLLGAQSPLL